MACELCAAPINIFKRKKCSECQRLHCSKCARKLQQLPTASSTSFPSSSSSASSRICFRCHRLLSLSFTRQDLDSYTVKELRQFLRRNDHRTDNCTEKADLVEAVMKMSQMTGERRTEDSEHSRHVEELKEKMMREHLSGESSRTRNETGSSGDPSLSPSASSSSSSSSTQLPPPMTPAASSSGVADSIPSPLVGQSSSGAFATPIGQSNSRSANPSILLPEPAPMPSVAMQVPSSEPIVGTPAKRMTLNQLSFEEEIENLSIRQLKELLLTNYVDYKGCCERQELMDRVKRLWQDNKRNKGLAVDEQGNTSDVELCKVCMDGVIDCILLECGHMVTCTQCGKRMAECPVCRHYVSRVVHVFKA